jgi:hypothetical protein
LPDAAWTAIEHSFPSQFDPGRPRSDNAQAHVDFTPIAQNSLRELTMALARTVRPVSQRLKQTVWAATIASRTVALQPGGGTDTSTLRFADTTAVVDAFRPANSHTGRPYRDATALPYSRCSSPCATSAAANEILAPATSSFWWRYWMHFGPPRSVTGCGRRRRSTRR